MSLEDYKKKVEDCLKTKGNFTEEEARKWMKTYEPDFKEFLEKEYSPLQAMSAMLAGY